MFLTDECEYRLGESVMIPLRLDAPAAGKIDSMLSMDRPDMVEILREPEFLAGQDLGFARIRTRNAGEVVLRHGDASLRIKVSSERPLAMMRQMRPRFTSPSQHSVVWGRVAIGAEMWVGAPGVDRAKVPDAILRLPDGREIQPAEAFPPVDGPFWRLVFHLDANDCPPGEMIMTIAAKPPIEGVGDEEILTSDPHTLVVLDTDAEDGILFHGECEDRLDTPRTERMGVEPPGVIMAPDASGFRAVGLRRGRPVWVIQPDIPEAGRYQLMLRARGTMAGSAYPSLRIVLGENARDSVSVRLTSADWHHVPVGRPIQLDAGKQWIGVGLANEFNYRNQIQRVADIDCYELRRVPDSAGAGEGGMMMNGNMAMADGDNRGASQTQRADRLAVAFTQPFHGDSIRGRTTLNATLRSPSLRNERDYRRIRSDLWVHGRVVASSYGQNPSFTIYPHDLQVGKNLLQIHSVSPCGNQALSIEHVLHADSPAQPASRLATTHHPDRYDLARGTWHKIDAVLLDKDHPWFADGAPTSAHQLKAEQIVRFDLSKDLHGKRRISLLGRSVPDAEPGQIVVTLHQPEARPRSLRKIPLPHHIAGAGWAWQPLDDVELVRGEKWLSIEILSGEAAIGGCSVDTEAFVDAAPPYVELLYPTPKSRVSADGDALVVRGFDDLAMNRFELQIDGKPSPIAYPAGNGTGEWVLHIPGTLLEPGTRRIGLIAIDDSGKRTITTPIEVDVVQESGPVLTMAYPRAIRLANNLGLGADSRTLADILIHGELPWLDTQLAGTHAEEPHLDAIAATWFQEIHDNNVRGRVAVDLVATRKPVRARFAMFVQNHFSTWIAKSGADAKWREHQAFRNVGPARFQDLLLTSATSPAMMVYLDQQNSFGRQLNENYAREVMELHTVGVRAGYSQDDVIHLAKLLSGWGAQRESTMDGMRIGYEYRYSPYLADPGTLEVFGLSIPAANTPDTADDRVRMAVEMLASRPQTARFIAEKLVAHYLGLPAMESAVANLEREFLRSGGNLRSMLSMLAVSPEMMSTQRQEKILNPVEFAVATQRAAGVLHPWSVMELADRSGRNLFDRASPDGFPETNEEYSDSNFQLQKWRFCKQLEWQLRGGIPSSAFHADAMAEASHRDALIDHAFAMRKGSPPSGSSRAAMHQILAQDISDHNQRQNLFTTFLLMTPEFQTR